MSEFEFLNLAISQWQMLLAFTALCVGGIWVALRKYLIAGIYDPLFFVFGVAYGINYGIILLLLANGLISAYLFTVVLAYGLLFILAFRLFSAGERLPLLGKYVETIGNARIGGAVFFGAVLLYISFSSILVSTIGFGLLAETNRFDVARGYGFIIRILDCLSPFIISYMTLASLGTPSGRLGKWAAIIIFVVVAAVISGAKVSVLFSFITILLTLFMSSPAFKVSPWKVAVAIVVGLSFSAFALQVNLDKNNVVDQNNAPLSNVSNMVVARLIYRVIAFGDTSYLILPNDVIDHLQTDSLAVRFAAPVVGNTNLSRALGYDVGNYTVGRQAVLFQTADTAVFGGPTSHFDLFAYVYLGPVGGGVFVIAIGLLLGLFNRSLRVIRQDPRRRSNILLVALSVTISIRAVLMLMEPAVGFAYIIDAFAIFSLLSLIGAVFVSSFGSVIGGEPASR